MPAFLIAYLDESKFGWAIMAVNIVGTPKTQVHFSSARNFNISLAEKDSI